MTKKIPTKKTSYEPPVSHFLPLDEEEAELIRMLEDPEVDWKPLSKEELKRHYEYFVADAKKSEPISIRIPRWTLRRLKSRAEKRGIPYQTIITTLVTDFMNDKIEIKL
jgi:predicted DNA binding CopG/RHH family protein